jgi:hypothetical protein
MLRVAAKSNCQDVDTCPQILDDPESGDVYVQGYDDVAEAVTAQAGTPAGERLIRIPPRDRDVLIQAGSRFQRLALFDRFTHEAFRWEGLPQYLVPQEHERFTAFLEGRPVPPRSPETSPWLGQIQRRSRAGLSQIRVHVVDWPLTDYLRFELSTDVENVAAGEHVRVAEHNSHPELDLTRPTDFWLFDGGTVLAKALLLRYDDQGHFLDAEVSTDPDVIARCRRHRQLALAHSVPLADYLERIGIQSAKVG